MFFAKNLKKKLDSVGLSQNKLAALIDETPSNMVSLLKGRRGLSENVLRKIASVTELNTSYEELKGWALADKEDLVSLVIASISKFHALSSESDYRVLLALVLTKITEQLNESA
jgi:transcriptional regulator with XRE-family HTH domain